ncbi:hypothetical protein AK812_SmicGene22602 [Symbiodinium microadriaticum]|uniref:Uncharacterized protein n=1 Tax=Symbiodinium microadriaticum TaxID=2951 RepID=A0A1Q9DJE1_SYMMI|nr:hypothetical protein AK812_SmicGene22602 [Symbiodinium microadriaticum]
MVLTHETVDKQEDQVKHFTALFLQTFGSFSRLEEDPRETPEGVGAQIQPFQALQEPREMLEHVGRQALQLVGAQPRKASAGRLWSGLELRCLGGAAEELQVQEANWPVGALVLRIDGADDADDSDNEDEDEDGYEDEDENKMDITMKMTPMMFMMMDDNDDGDDDDDGDDEEEGGDGDQEKYDDEQQEAEEEEEEEERVIRG